MELVVQYIIVGILLLFACYSIINLFRKNFSKNNKDKKKSGCDTNCGCS